MNRKQKKYVELKQAASWLMHVLITGGCKEVKQESDKQMLNWVSVSNPSAVFPHTRKA